MKLSDIKFPSVLRLRDGQEVVAVRPVDGMVMICRPASVSLVAISAAMLDPIPTYDHPVEEPEPEAEPVGTFEERNQASWAKWAGEQLGEQRELLLSLTKECDDLKAKLSAAEKQAEQARRLWSSWHEQKAVLAALDVEFGGKP